MDKANPKANVYPDRRIFTVTFWPCLLKDYLYLIRPPLEIWRKNGLKEVDRNYPAPRPVGGVQDLQLHDYGLDGILGLSQSFIGFIHSAFSTNTSWASGTGG